RGAARPLAWPRPVRVARERARRSHWRGIGAGERGLRIARRCALRSGGGERPRPCGRLAGCPIFSDASCLKTMSCVDGGSLPTTPVSWQAGRLTPSARLGGGGRAVAGRAEDGRALLHHDRLAQAGAAQLGLEAGVARLQRRYLDRVGPRLSRLQAGAARECYLPSIDLVLGRSGCWLEAQLLRQGRGYLDLAAAERPLVGHLDRVDRAPTHLDRAAAVNQVQSERWQTAHLDTRLRLRTHDPARWPGGCPLGGRERRLARDDGPLYRPR